MRPPGHHAGPTGVVTNPNDPHGSHGFCLLSNVAIGAAYAMAGYRREGEDGPLSARKRIGVYFIYVWQGIADSLYVTLAKVGGSAL